MESCLHKTSPVHWLGGWVGAWRLRGWEAGWEGAWRRLGGWNSWTPGWEPWEPGSLCMSFSQLLWLLAAYCTIIGQLPAHT
jgi:hypothetical protein